MMTETISVGGTMLTLDVTVLATLNERYDMVRDTCMSGRGFWSIFEGEELRHATVVDLVTSTLKALVQKVYPLAYVQWSRDDDTWRVRRACDYVAGEEFDVGEDMPSELQAWHSAYEKTFRHERTG